MKVSLGLKIPCWLRVTRRVDIVLGRGGSTVDRGTIGEELSPGGWAVGGCGEVLIQLP